MGERLQEGALVRTLGAGRPFAAHQSMERIRQHGPAGGADRRVIGAELVIALLYWRIFELDYVPTWWAWLLVPPALSALFIGLAGIWSSRRILARPPVTVLREAACVTAPQADGDPATQHAGWKPTAHPSPRNNRRASRPATLFGFVALLHQAVLRP